ncbi:MAG: GvpL/GvpF family gas vesicle protein [Gemmatimonadaceae bacterium]
MSSIRFFGIVPVEPGHLPAPVEGTEIVPFRDLGAIVAPAAYTNETPALDAAREHHQVITAWFSHRPVLPGPVGVVFRTREVLAHWMELHYVTLSDALSHLEGRSEARVDIRGRESDDREPSTESLATATESFRSLRRLVSGAVPLKHDQNTGIVLSAAFLIETAGWEAFVAEVGAEEYRTPSLRYEITGPWPPYDFVRMQLGG